MHVPSLLAVARSAPPYWPAGVDSIVQSAADEPVILVAAQQCRAVRASSRRCAWRAGSRCRVRRRCAARCRPLHDAGLPAPARHRRTDCCRRGRRGGTRTTLMHYSPMRTSGPRSKPSNRECRLPTTTICHQRRPLERAAARLHLVRSALRQRCGAGGQARLAHRPPARRAPPHADRPGRRSRSCARHRRRLALTTKPRALRSAAEPGQALGAARGSAHHESVIRCR